jgi:hypothetical protein
MFGSPTKKLVKRDGGGPKETSSAAPSSTKRSTPQKVKLTGHCILSNNKDLIVPMEATWSNQVDKNRAWDIIIKKQTEANRLQKTGH